MKSGISQSISIFDSGEYSFSGAGKACEYLKYFNTEGLCNTDKRYKYIDKDRLENILNSIINFGNHGINLLDKLKEQCNAFRKNIAFIICVDEDIKEMENSYAFSSEVALSPNSTELCVTIKDAPDNEDTRVVFNGKFTEDFKLSNLLNGDSIEAYVIAHELSHLVSFLSSTECTTSDVATNSNNWERRKNDWCSFLTTPRMESINRDLLENGLSQDSINSVFRTLFVTTEEARNLLGFEVDGCLFGEYCFLNQKNNFILPIYLNAPRTLTKEEVIVLNKIAEKFGIQFQNQEDTSIFSNCRV